MRQKFLGSRVFSLISLSLGFALAVGAVSCTRKQEAGGPRTLNLSIWSHYVSQDMLAEFTKKTGIQVQISNYSSNEELLAKLQAGASGYDVAVPSDYMVFAMIQLGLLEKIDVSKVPQAKQLDPRFLKRQFDPSNGHSLPYVWGTTGIGVNTALYKGAEVKGWKDLFQRPDLAGKMTLLDDARETIGAALKSLGYSLNSKSEAELKAAKEVLIKARGRVKGFNSEAKMPLANGETSVAHVYMSDALQAARETGGKVQYVLPEEGGTLWVDNFVIPKGAPHMAEAHEFIDFMLSSRAVAETVKVVMVAPANRDVFGILPQELRSNSALFPKDAVLKRFEMMEDLGEGQALWDRVWTEVKAER